PLDGVVDHADRRTTDPFDQIEPGKRPEHAQAVVACVHEGADHHQVVPVEGNIPQALDWQPLNAEQRQCFEVSGCVRTGNVHLVSELTEETDPGGKDLPVIGATLNQQTGRQLARSPTRTWKVN